MVTVSENMTGVARVNTVVEPVTLTEETLTGVELTFTTKSVVAGTEP